MNPDATYHVKLKDGTSSQLKNMGWYPFMTWLVHFGVARYADGRALVVFFTNVNGAWAAHPNDGLASLVVTEVPF